MFETFEVNSAVLAENNSKSGMEAEIIKNECSPKNWRVGINNLKFVKRWKGGILGVCTCLLLLAASVGIFYACKKDTISQKDSIKNHKSMAYYDEALVNRFMQEVLVCEFREYVNSLGIVTDRNILKCEEPCNVFELYDKLIEYSQRWDNFVDANPAACQGYIESERFPRYPMLFAFEVITNFYSLRAKIENELLELEAGDGISMENNPDNHFIVSEYMRTLLTTDCEIIAGDNIFLEGESQNLVIFNLDFEKLEQTKSLWRQYGETEGTVKAVQQGLAEPIYEPIHKDGTIDPCDALCSSIKIKYKLLSPSNACPYKYQFSIWDSYMTGCKCQVQEVRWNFGDGTFGGGYTTNHEYKVGGTYNVTVVVYFFGGKQCVKNISLRVDACQVTINTPVKDNTYTGNGTKYIFTANTSHCSGNTATRYVWNFGDGTTRTTPYDSAHHIYTMNATTTVTVSVTFNDNCYASNTFPITVTGTGDCCKYSHYDEKDDRYKDFVYQYPNDNNAYWLRHFFTTRQGPLWHRIVVKNNFYKKRANGNWYSQNAYKMFANFSGRIAYGRDCNLVTIYPNGCCSNNTNHLTYDYGVGRAFWITIKSIKSAFSIEMYQNGATDSKTDVIELHDYQSCP
jgi:hypothetical protein